MSRFSLYPDVEDKYKSDNTFRLVVDYMRSILRQYQITPMELRQASLLAATMHESENIKPLYVWMDEARNNIAMFGGHLKGTPKTATGASLNPPKEDVLDFLRDRLATAKEKDEPKGIKGNAVTERRGTTGNRRVNSTHFNNSAGERKDKHERSQSYYRNLGRTANGDRRKAAKLIEDNLNSHRHIFVANGYGFNVCECGISDVYYNGLCN